MVNMTKHHINTSQRGSRRVQKSCFICPQTIQMVRKDIDQRVIYFAFTICAVTTIVLACTDIRSWWIVAYDGGCLVAAKAPVASPYKAGVSGQRFRLEALRDASSLHTDYSGLETRLPTGE